MASSEPMNPADYSSHVKTAHAPSQAEAQLAVFAETNEHMRNAEQKQLAITGAYFGIVAVVVSLLPGGAITVLTARVGSAFLYLFMSVIGCSVFVYQAWCRVWKEHYLRIVCRIAQTWELPAEMLPYWLRQPPANSRRAAFKPNVDNTMMYLTFALNTLLVGLVAYQVLALLPYPRAVLGVILVVSSYFIFILWVFLLMLNRRDILRA